jgi:hypothetical protein
MRLRILRSRAEDLVISRSAAKHDVIERTLA